MASEQPKSEVVKDPKQFEWAVRDLEDFERTLWAGKDIAMNAAFVERTRAAAALIVEACHSGDVVLGQPIREALGIAEEDNRGFLSRIEELRNALSEERSEQHGQLTTNIEKLQKEHTAYKNAYSQLKGSMDDARGKLSDIEGYGPGDNPIYAINSMLDSGMGNAEEILDSAGIERT